ncbi:hypothetical protein [Yoonia sediminilitoris]|uniref:hypothetical protein n=1 Tax=Yoonia sediminilitoris TaxID=1286148 RepID=UPI000D3D052D|nr:hypothetical protein [Yoonia sediminilitoris]
MRLTIFGEGEEETALRALAQGDPRILFAGMASNPVEAYRKVDAVIMPHVGKLMGLSLSRPSAPVGHFFEALLTAWRIIGVSVHKSPMVEPSILISFLHAQRQCDAVMKRTEMQLSHH